MTNAQPWPAVAVLLLVGVVAGAGLAVLVSSLARRRGGDDTQRRRLATLTFAVVVAFFLILAMGRLMDPRLAEAALGAVAARVIRTAPDVLAAVVIVVAGIIVGSALGSLLRRRVHAVRPGLADVTGKLIHWAVIATALIIAATQVGIAVGVVERILLVVVGGAVLAAAVGVGLGSRHMVAAVIEGRHVAEIIRVGDEVEVDGLRGRVLTFGRASVRMSVDGVETEVPNTRFLDGAVFVHDRQR